MRSIILRAALALPLLALAACDSGQTEVSSTAPTANLLAEPIEGPSDLGELCSGTYSFPTEHSYQNGGFSIESGPGTILSQNNNVDPRTAVVRRTAATGTIVLVWRDASNVIKGYTQIFADANACG